MARPRSVMTPEVCETVTRAVEMGLPALRAAFAAGVTPSAVKSHRQRHKAFATALKKAEARAELRNVSLIQRAAADHWQAAAWMLERRWSERWARREVVTVTPLRSIKPDPRFD